MLHKANFEEMVNSQIAGSTNLWHRYAISDGFIFINAWVDFIFVDLEDFYIYEIEGGDIFLHASCLGTILVEFDVRDGNLGDIYEEIMVDVEGKVHEQELYNLAMETWSFKDNKMESWRKSLYILPSR